MKKFLTVIAVLSALALTGCGKADTAASIGDITITQAQAQSKIDELLAERAKINTAETQFETGNALNRSQLRFTIITTVFDEIAKELKITVSATELENSRQGIYGQIGGEAELSKSLVAAQIAPSNFDRYLRATIISNKLSGALAMGGVAEADIQAKISELLQKKAEQLNVTVNPRYGVWDDASGDLIAGDSAGSAVVPSNK
ncbi:SurA N-terminal domain containing protein [Candidatus Nanopelagicaceae bacterium]